MVNEITWKYLTKAWHLVGTQQILIFCSQSTLLGPLFIAKANLLFSTSFTLPGISLSQVSFNPFSHGNYHKRQILDSQGQTNRTGGLQSLSALWKEKLAAPVSSSSCPLRRPKDLERLLQTENGHGKDLLPAWWQCPREVTWPEEHHSAVPWGDWAISPGLPNSIRGSGASMLGPKAAELPAPQRWNVGLTSVHLSSDQRTEDRGSPWRLSLATDFPWPHTPVAGNPNNTETEFSTISIRDKDSE